MSVHRGTKAKWSWGPHTNNRMPTPAYNEFPLQMELPKSMRDLPEFTWGRWCRVVLRSNRGYRDGNWFLGTKNYTIMYKVDKSWFGFLSRPEIESQHYSHLLCTWWYKSRCGFQSFLWRPAMWIMATGFWNSNMVQNSCLSASSKVKRCAMKRALIVTWAFRVPSIYGMPKNCLSRTQYTQQVWDASHCRLATAKLNPQFEKTKNHIRLSGL